MAKKQTAPFRDRMKSTGQTQIAFWLPTEDAEALKAAAAKVGGASVAAFIRHHAVAAAKKVLKNPS